MYKYVLFILLISGLFSPSYSHTGGPEKVQCPVCKDSVVFHMTYSMTTFGSFMDFQQYGAIGYYYEEMINACKNCYYSGYFSDFDTTFTQSYIDSVNLVTRDFVGKVIDETLECEIAAEIKMLKPDKYDIISNIYLISSYFLKGDSTQISRRKLMQQKAINHLFKALENDEYNKDVVATVHYLIGELYRRMGDFENAITYFDFAIKNKKKQDWVKDIAKQQKELALKNDDDNSI